MNASEIRQKFVDFYTKQGFEYLPPASMLHPSIPMSFVMSAGLVQVETSLAKSQDRKSDKYVLVQNCFRHFDMETVGKDGTHLSLFEMPGAFVFSNNGKRETIRRMWQLATQQLEITSNCIWATYFSGGLRGELKLSADQTTYETWKSIGIPDERLIGLDVEHNYWIQGGGLKGDMDPVRKCGPNTELFFDRGKKFACSSTCKPPCNCGRFVEFSNSLFISNQLDSEGKKISPLSDPFIETVVGTERIAMIQQGTSSVFETCEYSLPMEYLENHCRIHPRLPVEMVIESKRVLLDYGRALLTLVNDGAPPPGRGGRKRIVKILIRGIIARQIIFDFKGWDKFSKFIEQVDSAFRNTTGLKSSHTFRLIKEYYEMQEKPFNITIKKGFKKLKRMLQQKGTLELTASDIYFLEKKMGLPKILIRYYILTQVIS